MAAGTRGPSWIFRYLEEPETDASRSLGHLPPVRPLVVVRLRAKFVSTRVTALVDSGSERCYANPALAREIGLRLDGAVAVDVGLGGENRRARFTDVSIELFPSSFAAGAQPVAEWAAEMGFLEPWPPKTAFAVLLGQKGFFDQFTVTMHRGVPALVIEPWEVFDERFGVEIAEADTRQPRFRP